MAYLGRPSAGDSPFAIGDKAMRDTSSPQPPSQRNPAPRRSPNVQAGEVGPGGFMEAPNPYGSVSDEARRRYEERYAKKRAEDAAKKAQEEEEERRKAAPQQEQQQQGGPPGGPPGGWGPPPPPPQQRYSPQPPPQGNYPPPQQHQQQPYGGPGGYGNPNPNNHPSQQQQYNHTPPPPPPPQQHQQHQQQQQAYGGQRPPSLQRPPSGYQSPPPSHNPTPPPQQQRWSQSGQPGPGPGPGSGGGGGPQWSSNAVPPPSQGWNKPQSPPPPQHRVEDQELHRMFQQFDSTRSGALSSQDLQRLLAKDSMMDAREDCVKMLMNIFDTDRSGSINFMEFEGLYRYIQDWHNIFLRFDRDGSGLIDRKELHQALLGFGFSLPSEMVRKLEKRYAPPPNPGQPAQRGIAFDRFLMACVTVKHYTEAFRRIDANGQGRINVDYNQFMEMVLDAPS